MLDEIQKLKFELSLKKKINYSASNDKFKNESC